MNRKYLVVPAVLAGLFVVATEAQAGKKLYVGNLPFYSRIVDSSTDPDTDLQHVSVSLKEAYSSSSGGTTPIQASATLGLVNPGSDGLGDAGFLDVFYDGSPSEFPASSTFNLFSDFTDPTTGERGVGHLRSVQGGGILIPQVDTTSSADSVSTPEILTSFAFEINPAQTGLSFSGLQATQGTFPDGSPSSFFDIFFEMQFDGAGSIDTNAPLFRMTFTSVPEPSTLVLAVAGIGALMAVARKRKLRAVS